MQTCSKCYKCANDISLNAIVLPRGFEGINGLALDQLEEEGICTKDKIIFFPHDYLSIVSYLTYISPNALREIYNYTDKPCFRKKYSLAVGYSYYRSICDFCEAAQGDHFIISEWNSPFHPINIENVKKLKFHKIAQNIQLSAASSSLGYDYIEEG